MIGLRARSVLARILICFLGLAGLGWAALWSSFREVTPFEGLARQIVAGEAFKDDVLSSAADQLDALESRRFAYAASRRSSAILRLRLLESAYDRAEMSSIDPRMVALRGAIHASLVAGPADSYMWVLLYLLDDTQNGFARDNLNRLATSYALGPREGWIASRRNRLGLSIFMQLDETTQESVVSEFAKMIDAQMIGDATINLAGAGWSIRNRLLASLSNVDLLARETFAKALYKQGINVSVPGVAEMGERPWR